MGEPLRVRVERVMRLVEAAQRIADPGDPLGRRARKILPASTGLSPEGVELALLHSLEVHPSAEEISRLCGQTAPARRCHVLLSSNVFVAAHRAIALALAGSASVHVRPSRREPTMTMLLHEASRGAFQVVEELVPSPGERVWAYGSDTTLASLREELPSGVVLHAHGTGIGVAVVEPRDDSGDGSRWLERVAERLALDVVLFDQRGCLSPRLVVTSSADLASQFAVLVRGALGSCERKVPRGEVSPEERAQAHRYRDTMLYVSDVMAAGKGWVGVDLVGDRLVIPPVGRLLHVARVVDVVEALGPLSPALTTIGYAGPPELKVRLAESFPHARVTELGRMQQPPFDGPVDRRPVAAGELL